MIAYHQLHYLSAEKYLQLEEQSQIKHEYINGQVYAMAGASDAQICVD